MLVPLSWLKDFAPFPDDAALLRSTLDDLGLVVEAIEFTGNDLDDVIVARIEEIDTIDGADKVRKVVVDAGAGPVEIVCGATNFALGDLVPLAPVGAILPGDFKIAKRTMRGVVSNGMLCSGKELGLGDDHDGLLILTNVGDATPGRRLVDALTITPDVIFDVAIEGNRPDAHCIAGIARDLAARLDLAYIPVSPTPPIPEGPPVSELATAEVVDSKLCPRLGLGVARQVEVTKSPQWIQERLSKAGMRPINNVVDASNYVMIELGQPTHPYDRERVGGQGLRVRRAKPGETILTLDGVERTLGIGGKSLGDTGEDCVICDANDVAIGIAGIMGGASSEISSSTTEILLEAAAFNPIGLTRTSRRLAHRTDAAARFQKGTDPAGIERAMDRFFELLALSSPALVVAPDPLVIPQKSPEPFTVMVPLIRVTRLLGVPFNAEDIDELLSPLGFGVRALDNQILEIAVPTNRPDIRSTHHGIADICEEIARVYGYSKLPRRAMAWSQPGQRNAHQSFRSTIRELFLGLGASEAWTSSLVAAGEIEHLGIIESEIVIANPLTADESRLRRTLLPGLLRTLGYNADRRQDGLAMFEIGNVFIHPDAKNGGRTTRGGNAGTQTLRLPREQETAVICFARSGDDATIAVAAFGVVADALRLLDVRLRSEEGNPIAAGLHPTRQSLLVDATTGATFGSLGEVDPAYGEELAPGLHKQRIAVLTLDLGVLGDPSQVLRKSPVAQTVSRFPSADLDLAFVVADAVPVDHVADALKAGAGDLLEGLQLFDVYRGAGVSEGQRSLAFTIRLCSMDRTLTDEEISETRNAMIDAVSALGGSLR